MANWWTRINLLTTHKASAHLGAGILAWLVFLEAVMMAMEGVFQIHNMVNYS